MSSVSQIRDYDQIDLIIFLLAHLPNESKVTGMTRNLNPGSAPARGRIEVCLGGVRALLALGVILAASGSSPAAPVADEVGFVLEMSGQWVVEGTPERALAEGDKLEAGARVHPKEPAPARTRKAIIIPELTVSLYNGDAAVYKGPATLPARPSSTRPNRIWSLIHSNSRGMGGYVHPVSRGLGDDAVVKLDGASLDLTPLFAGPSTESYGLRLDRVGRDKSAAVALKISKGSTTIKADGLKPGLYDTTVLADANREVGRSWLLVCPATGFDQASKTYAEAVALSNKWDRQVSALAVSRFRQACLISLAESLDR